MENDIWSVIFSEFDKWLHESDEVAEYWKKISDGVASYIDANKFSEMIGKKWSEILLAHVGPGIDVDPEILIDTIEKTLKRAYANSAYYAKKVQELVNQDAGIGMKALEPAIDKYRIQNLIEKLVNGESIDDLILDQMNEWLLSPQILENISRSAVTDTIQANARIQSEAGLKTVMIRHIGSDGCCEWCRKMADGVAYEYGKQPADFWRIHHNCTCWIEYKPVKGSSKKIRYGGGKKITG